MRRLFALPSSQRAHHCPIPAGPELPEPSGHRNLQLAREDPTRLAASTSLHLRIRRRSHTATTTRTRTVAGRNPITIDLEGPVIRRSPERAASYTPSPKSAINLMAVMLGRNTYAAALVVTKLERPVTSIGGPPSACGMTKMLSAGSWVPISGSFDFG